MLPWACAVQRQRCGWLFRTEAESQRPCCSGLPGYLLLTARDPKSFPGQGCASLGLLRLLVHAAVAWQSLAVEGSLHW